MDIEFAALDKNEYTWTNALLWGDFIGHCKKSGQCQGWQKAVHLIIAFFEFWPGLGQIVSFAETSFLKYHFNHKTPSKPLTERTVTKQTDSPIPIPVTPPVTAQKKSDVTAPPKQSEQKERSETSADVASSQVPKPFEYTISMGERGDKQISDALPKQPNTETAEAERKASAATKVTVQTVQEIETAYRDLSKIRILRDKSFKKGEEVPKDTDGATDGSFPSLVQEFQKKGGHLNPVITIVDPIPTANPQKPTRQDATWKIYSKEAEATGRISQIHLDKDDIIYPVCNAGTNRSQIVYKLLNSAHFKNVQAPHGIWLGYDPLILPPTKIMKQLESQTRLNQDEEEMSTARELLTSEYPGTGPLPKEGLLGHLRHARIGEKLERSEFVPVNKSAQTLFGRGISKQYDEERDLSYDVYEYFEVTDKSDLENQREWMNKNYFDPIINSEKPVKIICFDKAAHGMLFRIIERAKKLGIKSLDHITIIPIDSKDPFLAEMKGLKTHYDGKDKDLETEKEHLARLQNLKGETRTAMLLGYTHVLSWLFGLR